MTPLTAMAGPWKVLRPGIELNPSPFQTIQTVNILVRELRCIILRISRGQPPLTAMAGPWKVLHHRNCAPPFTLSIKTLNI